MSLRSGSAAPAGSAPMTVAVYLPDGLPESFCVYVDNLSRELSALGVTIRPFKSLDELRERPEIVWDPRGGGGNPPRAFLKGAPAPLVVTVHGVAPMALPVTEYFTSWRKRYRGWLGNRWRKRQWRAWHDDYAAVITVSEAGKKSILENLPIDPARLFVCPNGADLSVFTPSAEDAPEPYLFHISNDEPRKNVDRIIAAYRKAVPDRRVELRLKLRSGSRRQSGDGVRVITARLSDAEVADQYRHALAFLFPSLYEGFGLPIIEAMAAGCPVITSDDTACVEVAGAAALCVPPRSVDAIASAITTILNDPARRSEMRAAGFARAAGFTWRRSAELHRAVFDRVRLRAEIRTADAA